MAIIVALVLIGSGALTAIMHALAVLLIAAAVAIPVTAVSVIALAANRTRSDRPGRPDGPVWVPREPPERGLDWRKPPNRLSARPARCTCISTSTLTSSPQSCGTTSGRNDHRPVYQDQGPGAP